MRVELIHIERDIEGRPAVAYARATGTASSARKKANVAREVELNRADFAQLLAAHDDMTPALAAALRSFLVVRREDLAAG